MSSRQAIEQAVAKHLKNALTSVETPAPSFRGKVRDVFFRGNQMFMVVSDRISAFDRVLGTIPLKGALLCEQSAFWFNETKSICKNHLLDRSDPQIMVCKKAQPLAIEVIVRGYLAGSLLREDKFSRGSAYGLKIDPDLRAYQRFDTPILTPTTKAESGSHDEAITPEKIIATNLLSSNQWQEISSMALNLFAAGTKVAQKNGLLLVDTKYEFGLIDDQIHLIDEIHTCDSSRFFMVDDYLAMMKLEKVPTMLDKEFFRQYLIKSGMKPNETPPADFVLNDHLRAEVAARYFTLTEKITGHDFVPPSEGAHDRVLKNIAHLDYFSC